MPITIGTQLGVHEITGLLGKGGMGEVYRARDTKLKREVAIKVLPDELSRDPDRVHRFQREAEVLASLNHPNRELTGDPLRIADPVGTTATLGLSGFSNETGVRGFTRWPIPYRPAGGSIHLSDHAAPELEAEALSVKSRASVQRQTEAIIDSSE